MHPVAVRGVGVSGGWRLLEWQRHIAQVPLGLNQNQRTCVNADWLRSFARHVGRLCLCGNSCLYRRDLGCIRVHPLQARALCNLDQLLGGQRVGCDLGHAVCGYCYWGRWRYWCGCDRCSCPRWLRHGSLRQHDCNGCCSGADCFWRYGGSISRRHGLCWYAQVGAVLAFAAVTSGSTLTAVTVAGALLTGLPVFTAWRLCVAIDRRLRVNANGCCAVVRICETELALRIVFTTGTASFAILARTTAIAPATAIAAAFATTFSNLAAAFADLALVAWSIYATFSYGVSTAFCPGLLVTFTGFVALATATSTAAAAFTPFAGCTVRTRLLAIAVRSCRALAVLL